MTERAVESILTPPARRAIADELPEAVAAAVIDFITTALLHDTHLVGTPLSNDLDGVWSARRGTYRVLYRINQGRREAAVLRVGRRRGPRGPKLTRRHPALAR